MTPHDEAPGLGPTGARRRYHPAAIAVTAVGVIGLTLIATRPPLPAWEERVFEAVNRQPDGWALVLIPIMQAGTLLAGPVAALIAVFARRRLLALELVIGGVGAWVIARALKLLVARPRPAFLLEGVILRGGEEGGLGYPSGHVSVAMTLATILAAWLPGRWEWIFWVVVVATGIARMYVGAHLPLDVFGGVLLGGLTGAGIRALSHAGRVQPLVRRIDQ